MKWAARLAGVINCAVSRPLLFAAKLVLFYLADFVKFIF